MFLLIFFLFLSISTVLAGDYYETLGVPRNANSQDIKKAYRTLSRKFHPDVSKENNAAAIFKDIGRAYEILSDSELRQIYDQHGDEGITRHEQGQGQPGANHPFSQFFGGNAFFSTNGGTFRMNFGGQQQQTRGPDFDLPMKISLEKIYTGVHFDMLSPSGDVDIIHIEPGIPHGHIITLSGLAEQPRSGRPLDPGDLKIHILQTPHPYFQRIENDLKLTIQISLKDSLVGFVHPIKHLDDSTFLFDRSNTITPHNSVIKVPGKGMPIYNSGRFGDLFITVNVEWPTSLTNDQRQVLNQILS